MKKFVSENWYKLMIGSSLLMASFGFMVHSSTSAMADSKDKFKFVETNADGSINVKLSDEQLNKIIPKNADGSINVKLTQEQLKKIAPPTSSHGQDVVIVGWKDYANNFIKLPYGSHGWNNSDDPLPVRSY